MHSLYVKCFFVVLCSRARQVDDPYPSKIQTNKRIQMDENGKYVEKTIMVQIKILLNHCL